MGTPCLAHREHHPMGTTRLPIRDEQTLPTLFILPRAQTVVHPHPRWRGLFAHWWIGYEVNDPCWQYCQHLPDTAE